MYIMMKCPISSHRRSVCVFDSGIGGINLLFGCVKKIPYLDFIYVADNGNVPYGNLPEGRIRALADAAFEKIAELNPCAAVIACNTVTALCAEQLRKKYGFPILGIQPAIKPAVRRGGRCLVLATAATLKSPSFRELLKRYGGENTVVYACAELAGYIEEHIFSLPDRLPEGLLPDLSADAVVLGCTHYAFASDTIKKRYGCPVFDGVVGTVDHLIDVIGKEYEIEPEPQKISFLGGDIDKNRAVFDLLCQKTFL